MIAAVLVAMIAAAAAYVTLAPRHVPPGQPALATIDQGSLADLRSAFNAGPDHVRVLVMLSPT